MKKGGIGMSPLLLGLGAKLLLLKALAIAGLAFMSVKALVLSKIALVLAVIFGAQSLFGGAFSLKVSCGLYFYVLSTEYYLTKIRFCMISNCYYVVFLYVSIFHILLK